MAVMIIRQERPADYDEVRELVKTSFATNADDDGTTHTYLDELRNKDVFIPELSLVAERENKIVGQVVLYKTIITTPQEDITELLLSPICVHPDYFKQGIARAMIEEVLSIAKKMGYTAVFLCGNPETYKKMGFVPTYKHSIYHKSDESKAAEWSMVRKLSNAFLRSI